MSRDANQSRDREGAVANQSRDREGAVNPVHSLARSFWGIEELYPLQEGAITAARLGQDSLVVLPTGGGKSLCYQLPAACSEGLTVVVSPLIALMQDQVDSLKRRSIPAELLNSMQHPTEHSEIADRIGRNLLRLLYVSPERLMDPEFVTVLATTATLGCFVIDEAHCISQWGHEFRPAYRGLANLRKLFPTVPIHAFTASATPQVRADICEVLGLRTPKILIGNFDRPNLRLRVQKTADSTQQTTVASCLLSSDSCLLSSGDGLIYVPTRRAAELLANELVRHGHDACPYHAGMPDTHRRAVQAWFMAPPPAGGAGEGRTNHSPLATNHSPRIVVATIAFGMGIDKPAIRWVIHAGMPSSVETYHQEIGRAGRDGRPAECIIFRGPDDYDHWLERFATADLPDEIYDAKLRALQHIDTYCGTPGCRHYWLTHYFAPDQADQAESDCIANMACDGLHSGYGNPICDGHTGARDQGSGATAAHPPEPSIPATLERLNPLTGVPFERYRDCMPLTLPSDGG